MPYTFTRPQINQARIVIANALSSRRGRSTAWTGLEFSTILWAKLPWVKNIDHAKALLKAALRFEAN